MAKTLYIGNLASHLTEEALNEVFKDICKVLSVQIIKDDASGKSKNFGFVELENDEDVESAIEQLNNKEIEGRKILIINSD